MRLRLFVPSAVVIGLCYVFITPPFHVPDESAHFWRGLAVANGVVLPQRPAPAVVRLPHGFLNLVWSLRDSASISKLEQTRSIQLERENVQPVRYPALYTPLPYLPQSIAAFVGMLAEARPVTIFYAGRILNLLFAIGVFVLAMRVAPDFGAILAGVALLPMTMFLFGSWSADASTIALGALYTALALRGRSGVALAAVALAIGLCKPAYFLLAAIVWLTPRSRTVRIGTTLAMIAGTVISTIYVRSGYFNMRLGLPVDPDAQWRCIVSDPLRFARVVAQDISNHTRFYVEETVGRLGFNDLILPAWVILTALALLIAIAATRGVDLPVRVRLGGVAIFIASALGILLSQYLIWSIVCGETIDGVQGRYFLPLLPLALAAVSARPRRWSIPDGAIVAVAALCNAAALGTLTFRYW